MPDLIPTRVAFLYLFCFAFGTGGASPADSLRLAIQVDIRGLNPGVTRDGDTDTVHQHIFESLVAYDAELNVRLMLAENLNVSTDGRRYEFTLREGVTFHNGESLTANHVVWNWQRMLDPATGWRCRTWYDGSNAAGVNIESVTAPDSKTIVFEIEQPSSVFLDRMAYVQCFTAIMHPDSIDSDGEIRRPIGTGPYRLREWRRGEFVELERYPGYRSRSDEPSGYAGRKRALIPVVRFMIIPDAAVAEAALLSGDIDILTKVPLHLVSQLERVPDVATTSTPQLYWMALLLQSADPLLADSRIRKALAHAINIDQVAAIATFDHAMGNPSAVPRTSRFHDAAHDRALAYDPEKARKLLVAAGYDGSELRLQTNRKFPAMFDSAIAVQAMLTAVGVNVRLEVLDWATQLANYFDGDFQLMSFGYSGRTHPVLNYATILGDRSRNPAYQWGDPQALQLLAHASRTDNEIEQRKDFTRLHGLMIEQVPILGLYNEFQVDAVRGDVRGYEPWQLGRPRLWNVTKNGE